MIRKKFAARSYEKEIMDDFQGKGPDWDQALRELKIINNRLGGNAVTTNGIANLLQEKAPEHALSIADLGCGGGDMLVVMANWARKQQLEASFYGIDVNNHIVEYARKNTAAYPEIKYLAADIFSEKFGSRNFDVVTCSLFTHHFTDEELVKMLSRLKKQVRLGIVINDLHRHPLAYYSISLLTSLFSRSRMVRNDGPLSVLRGFSKKDWERVLQAAGISSYTIRWRWAFRWELVIPAHQKPFS